LISYWIGPLLFLGFSLAVALVLIELESKLHSQWLVAVVLKPNLA
jgi:hypothetical protein